MKKIISILLVGAALTLSGCASFGAAEIRSEPSGAQVVDAKTGVLLGVTPVVVTWREDGESSKFVNIRVQKSGYEDKTNPFWVTLRHDSREKAKKDPQSVKMTLEKLK